jgi:hypothetical protein
MTRGEEGMDRYRKEIPLIQDTVSIQGKLIDRAKFAGHNDFF